MIYFKHHLRPASYDVVVSFGVFEHFDDARPVVQRQTRLRQAGRVSIDSDSSLRWDIRLMQRWCDAPNLAFHNLAIMSPCALMALVDSWMLEVHPRLSFRRHVALASQSSTSGYRVL